MRLFERVVIPIEPGPRAQALLTVAGQLVHRFHSRITLVYTSPHDSRSEEREALLQQVRRKFDFWGMHLCRTGARSVEPVLVEGPATLGIEQVAGEQRATLIVTAAELETPQHKAWFGTSTQRLARRLTTPLMIIRPNSTPTLQPMLALVDFSDASRFALQQAIEMAVRFDSRLTILHVSAAPLRAPHFDTSIWSFGNINGSVIGGGVMASGAPLPAWRTNTLAVDQDLEVDYRLDAARDELNEFLAGFDLSRVSHDRVVLAGSPVPETLSYARKRKIGLIVTGAGMSMGLTGVSTQSPAEALAELSEIPVMILRHQPLRMMLSREQSISRSHYM